MKLSLKLSTFFTIFLLSFSSCTSAPSTPTINPTQGAQLLAGEYTTTITAEDLAKIKSLDPGLANNIGTWNLSLTNDGKFTANQNGKFIADGNYTVKNDRIEVYVLSACDDCGCVGAIGRFVWKLQDNKLSFGKTAGTCDAMDLLLTSHPLTRKP